MHECALYNTNDGIKTFIHFNFTSRYSEALLIQQKKRLGGFGVKRHFKQYFSYIVTVSFIGGGNQSTWRKPPSCRKSLTNKTLIYLSIYMSGLAFYSHVENISTTKASFHNDGRLTLANFY